MCVAQQHGLVFNGEKCEVKKYSVTLFCTVYNTDGTHPNPKKVDTVHQMPSLETSSQLQQFLGMVIYLSPFIPSLSTHTAPLRELLKKDSYQKAFNRIRELVCEDMTLHYFDVWKPVTIQVDASGKELHFSRKDIQLPLPPKLLSPQSNDMPT